MQRISPLNTKNKPKFTKTKVTKASPIGNSSSRGRCPKCNNVMIETTLNTETMGRIEDGGIAFKDTLDTINYCVSCRVALPIKK
jgi:uncharacterized protein with PIN domain